MSKTQIALLSACFATLGFTPSPAKAQLLPSNVDIFGAITGAYQRQGDAGNFIDPTVDEDPPVIDPNPPSPAEIQRTIEVNGDPEHPFGDPEQYHADPGSPPLPEKVSPQQEEPQQAEPDEDVPDSPDDQ